ncbi:MAG: nucleoside deaminase [Desulfopila sp.]
MTQKEKMAEIRIHEYYMKMALDEARLALEQGEFPVGCVIADDGGVVVGGGRQNSARGNELDHAEIVALRKLVAEYPHKVGQSGLVLYSTMEPCLMCFSTLLLNNVHTIVYGYEDVMGGATTLVLQDLKPLYATMQVEVVPAVLRRRSLQLFKRFFQDNASGYWHDSLLARYTLEQE